MSIEAPRDGIKDKLPTLALTTAQFAYNVARGVGNHRSDILDGWNKKPYLVGHLGNPNDPERVIIRDRLKTLDISSILDAGCGSATEYVGYASDDQLRNIKYVGLDGNQNMLDVAQEKITGEDFNNAHLVRGDLRKTPFPENSFDAVLLKHVLEHQPSYEEALKEAIKVARKCVIVNFFQTLLGNGLPDIHITHREGIPYNWYNRTKFEKFVRSNPKVKEFDLVHCRGIRRTRSDIYTILLNTE